MTFEAWLKSNHDIDHKTFDLRHPTVQAQMIKEYNQMNRALDVNNHDRKR